MQRKHQFLSQDHRARLRTKMNSSKFKQIFFSKEDCVSWTWMGQTIDGRVIEIFLEPITKEIKGKKIKRNGSPSNPAYYVQSKAGNYALKLHSELSKQDLTRKKLSTKNTPKMFS